jgi:hypothetical protein
VDGGDLFEAARERSFLAQASLAAIVMLALAAKNGSGLRSIPALGGYRTPACHVLPKNFQLLTLQRSGTHLPN